MEMLRSWNHPEGNAILTKIYLEKNWFSGKFMEFMSYNDVFASSRTC